MGSVCDNGQVWNGKKKTNRKCNNSFYFITRKACTSKHILTFLNLQKFFKKKKCIQQHVQTNVLQQWEEQNVTLSLSLSLHCCSIFLREVLTNTEERVKERREGDIPSNLLLWIQRQRLSSSTLKWKICVLSVCEWIFTYIYIHAERERVRERERERESFNFFRQILRSLERILLSFQ